MKQLSIQLKVVFISIFLLTSCTENFEEINVDSNKFTDASPEQLFAGSVLNTLNLVGGTLNDQLYNNYASYYGGKGGQFPRFFYLESSLDSYWNTFYIDILKNNQLIIDNYADDIDYKNRVLIAKIWRSYVFSILVSTFGPVPFQDAINGMSNPKYDTEEFIYESILEDLKEASDSIVIDGDTLSQDPIFDGNLDKWIKFSNTLRLKIALRISDAFPNLAQSHGADVMSEEGSLLTSNADNIALKWEANAENWSYNYNRYVFLQPSEDVLPYVNFHFLLNLKTYQDPRLFEIVEPSSNPIIVRDRVYASGSTSELIYVEYELPYFGRPLGGNNIIQAWGLNGDANPLSGIETRRFCRPNADVFMSKDMKYYISTFAELNFLKAEAKLKGWGGDESAEQYYYKGIDASFEQYGVSGVEEYKSQHGIQWGTASAGDRGLFNLVSSGISSDPLDKIVRQRWLSSFNQGHDMWCLQKRTRLLPIIDHFNPDGATGLDYAPIPERMIYPVIIEGATNDTNLQEAISTLTEPVSPSFPSGNSLYSRLQINKQYDPIDWPRYGDPSFTIDFLTNFYGDSEDDLINAGVNYIKL
ncbi:SusD/RagB family nutrient-binding outer membrane lipoprotein [Winogradskyella sp.]|uniref:SusD/RagB family nutrient-binding outer membrane lipoprotein n=1 Tax=Winogradskyella sp. TaxID=1883156 RepID=UPI003512A4C5